MSPSVIEARNNDQERETTSHQPPAARPTDKTKMSSITTVATAMNAYNADRNDQTHAALAKEIAECPLEQLSTPEGKTLLAQYWKLTCRVDYDVYLYAPSRVRLYGDSKAAFGEHKEIYGEVAMYTHNHRLETCCFDLIREFIEQRCEPCRLSERAQPEELLEAMEEWAGDYGQDLHFEDEYVAESLRIFVDECSGGYFRLSDDYEFDEDLIERVERAFANVEEDMSN